MSAYVFEFSNYPRVDHRGRRVGSLTGRAHVKSARDSLGHPTYELLAVELNGKPVERGSHEFGKVYLWLRSNKKDQILEALGNRVMS